jgi:hypothetical protein
MTFRPYTIARYGVWVALSVAALSVWLATRAGIALDQALLRAVFFFLLITVMAFGAEAVLLVTPPTAHSAGEPESSAESETTELAE